MKSHLCPHLMNPYLLLLLVVGVLPVVAHTKDQGSPSLQDSSKPLHDYYSFLLLYFIQSYPVHAVEGCPSPLNKRHDGCGDEPHNSLAGLLGALQQRCHQKPSLTFIVVSNLCKAAGAGNPQQTGNTQAWRNDN